MANLASLFLFAAILTFAGSASVALAAAPTTTTLAVTANGNIVLAASSPILISLTATVKSGSAPLTAGQVNFCDASATYCTDVHILATAQITPAGTATFQYRPGVGTHHLKAVFLGTTAYASSSSATAILNILGTYPSYLTPTQSGTGSSRTLSATVNSGKNVPYTGTVTFTDASNGNTVLGSVTLPAGVSEFGLVPVTSPAASAAAQTFVLGDFNGDGFPDAHAALSQFLTGNGDGTFSASTGYTDNSGFPMFAADFNSDGNLDYASFVNYEDEIPFLDVFLLNGDGTFASNTASSILNNADVEGTMVVADFNRDGIPDVVYADYASGAVSFWQGTGRGNFLDPVAAGNAEPSPSSVATGDFNGDGIPDLVFGSCTAHVLSILLGKGDGTFTASTTPPFPSAHCPTSIAVADFNLDGKTDLVPVDGSDSSMNPLMGNGDGTFTSGTIYNYGADRAAVADFNGDGIPDMAFLSIGTASSGSTVRVIMGRGDGTFLDYDPIPLTGSPQGVAAADLNADGLPDIVVMAPLTSLISSARNATASITATIPPATGTHTIHVTYSGDTRRDPASSTILVASTVATPQVTLASSASRVAYGTPLTFTAAVSGVGNAPTGTVTFFDGATSLGAYPVTISGRASAPSTATLTLSTLGVGQHFVTAQYSGDTNYSAAVSSAITAIITEVAPTVTVTSSANPAMYGTSITFTATVAGNGGGYGPSGTVTFYDGSFELARTSLGCCYTGPTSSTGTFAVGTLSPGPHSITAKYSGDGNYFTTTSPVLTQTVSLPAGVSASATTMTVTAAGSAVTTVAARTAVTLTANVSISGSPVTQGTVTFCDQALPDSCAMLAVGTAPLTSSGKATFTVTPGIGSHSYYAHFAGTSTEADSNSAMSSLSVTGRLIPAVTITSSGTTAGYNLYATVLGDGAKPTGSVSFIDTSNGNKVLGSVELGAANTAYDSFNTVTTPGTVAGALTSVGDFNNDGILDIVAGEYIYYGVGDGTFTAGPKAPAVTPPVSGQGSSTVTGDFNNDGYPDYAFAEVIGGDDGGTAIVTQLSDGKGNYTSVTSDAVPPDRGYNSNANAQLATGDFNGDGLLDIVAAWSESQIQTTNPNNPPTQFVSYLMSGDGAGYFSAIGGSAGVGLESYASATIQTGNFSGSEMDAAMMWCPYVNKTSEISFLSYTPLQLSGCSSGILAGDFNGDGKTDLAILVAGQLSVVSEAQAKEVVLPGIAFPAGSGIHLIKATYSGDSNYNAGSNATISLSTPAIVSTITLTASPNPVAYSKAVTLTAKVTGASAVPTGTVSFYNASTLLGTATLNTSGIATLAVTTLPAGVDSKITAKYAGNVDYSASTSPAISVTVTRGTPTISLAASATMVALDTPFTLTVTVTGSGAVPTGTVSLKDGTTPLGSATLTSGVVSFTVSSDNTSGSHSYTAYYAGSTTYTAVTSSAAVVQVSKATPSITLSPSATSITGGATVTFTAYVSGPGVTPTGTVSFMLGSTTLGTSTLSGGAATFATANLPPVTDSVTAKYLGDANYNSATSASATVTVIVPLTAPTISPAFGTYSKAVEVTLSAAVKGTLYYTTDGSTPTNKSARYTGAIAVASTKTIKAINYVAGQGSSPVATATFTIQ